MFVSSSTGQYRFHVINIYILIYIFKKKSGSIPNYTRTTFTVVFFFSPGRVYRFLKSGTQTISPRSGWKRNCPSFAEQWRHSSSSALHKSIRKAKIVTWGINSQLISDQWRKGFTCLISNFFFSSRHFVEWSEAQCEHGTRPVTAKKKK